MVNNTAAFLGPRDTPDASGWAHCKNTADTARYTLQIIYSKVFDSVDTKTLTYEPDAQKEHRPQTQQRCTGFSRLLPNRDRV